MSYPAATSLSGMTALVRTNVPMATSIAHLVVGTSGGVGASTLAAAVAAARAGSGGPSRAQRGFAGAVHGATLVDLDLARGGIDVTVGLEHVGGPRWPDLMRARGRVDGVALRRLLPQAHDCAVLAANGRRWARPGEDGPGAEPPDRGTVPSTGLPGAVSSVLDALRLARPPLVIDCPAARVGEIRRPGDVLVLVGSTSVRGLADLDAAAAAFADGDPRVGGAVILVLRGGAADDEVLDVITDQTGVPVFGHVGEDRRVSRAEARGDWPGLTGSLRRLALDIVDVADELAA